ncbi:DDE-type integrase/transposase/recombinase [Limibacillus sp. MBR-115]|jgi:putative transposase|uniref:DDE-type integrase/transposase/recombinase n=1 Tax=Limibacillus sp. MBR-115 TaxID=3156465 RepID=UPI00339543FB
MPKRSPFRHFKTSPEIIRLAIMMYIRFPLSLRNVEDLLHERGIDISHETVRFWWQRFGPMFAAEIRKRRIQSMRSSLWRWHLDEVFVKINGEQHYLWRAVDHEGEASPTIAAMWVAYGSIRPVQRWRKQALDTTWRMCQVWA